MWLNGAQLADPLSVRCSVQHLICHEEGVYHVTMTRQQVECNFYQTLQGIPQALWETSGPIEKRDGQLRPLAGRAWLPAAIQMAWYTIISKNLFLSFRQTVGPRPCFNQWAHLMATRLRRSISRSKLNFFCLVFVGQSLNPGAGHRLGPGGSMGRRVLLRFAACICSKSFVKLNQTNVVPVIAYLRSSLSFDPPNKWKTILQDRNASLLQKQALDPIAVLRQHGLVG